MLDTFHSACNVTMGMSIQCKHITSAVSMKQLWSRKKERARIKA